MRRVFMVLALAATMLLASASVALAGQPEGPTCFDFDGEDSAATHGQHVIGDYVTGVGHDNQSWPPNGTVGGGGGAILPGGPGPGFHFPNGVAPGASFCTDSQSPGIHL